MLVIIAETVSLLRDLFTAAYDKLSGCERCRLEHSIFITAPPAQVWRKLGASYFTIDGAVQIECRIRPVPGDEGLYRIRVRVAEEEEESSFRVLEVREGQGFMAQHLPKNPDSPYLAGAEHYFGGALSDHKGGTLYTQFDELTFRHFGHRLAYPLFVRWQLRQLARRCEAVTTGALQPQPVIANWI